MDLDIIHFSNYIYAYAVSNDELNVRIRLRSKVYDNIKVYYKNLYDHSKNIYSKNMIMILDDGIHSLYEATIQIKERHFKYYFELSQGLKTIAYTADGLIKEPASVNYFYYPAINDDEIITLPGWAEGEIIYQILVDRFYDGDAANNPKNVKSIDALPDRNTYYGGDFVGIIKKMDYIKSLGVKIIYLSPLFLSPTYHKYDVSDYYKIEDTYGGTVGLINLVETAHRNGIKVILDCVFNHCSAENELFQDVIKYGEASLYKDWFYIESFPIDIKRCNYDTFAGEVPSMPKFNTSNPDVINYLTDVAVHWTKTLDLDGWRLDVADEVSMCFWREFRRKVKAVKPEVLIIGEVWNHASKWMQGDQFDTVTNYKYRKWLVDFICGNINSSMFWQKISGNKMLYKTPSFNYLVNLIGSHDTIRFRTLVDNEKLHYLALLLTLTLDGMPLIYYGDEVGLEGQVDPDNRRAFRWNDINKEELKLIQSIGKLRESSTALKKGETIPLKSDERVLAFRRKYGNDMITVVLNFSNKVKKMKFNIQKVLYGELSVKNDSVYVQPYSIIIGL
ncbi:MAG: glycoside hydrolase family 13 protein [Bacilli bacterium]|nr:glycoside hydrolase family 13 protein [Bacilli bacterium]